MPLYLKNNKLTANKLLYSNISINKNIIPNHINIATSNRLFGKNPLVDRDIYTYQDPYHNGIGRFVRNPSCWLNGVKNISCFSPAQLSGYNWRTKAGTLITTKHIILAEHFGIAILPGAGTPIIFVDDNNNVIRRNIVASIEDPNNSDILISKLDNDVPSNIKIAKVLPPNFTDYFSGTVNGYGRISFNPKIYAIALDQEEKAILKLLTATYRASSNIYPITGYTTNTSLGNTDIPSSDYATMNPSPLKFINFFETIITGDSGNPVFMLIDNELVILTTWLTPSSGPFTSGDNYELINNLINTLSPGEGYSLTPIDLASIYDKYA